MKKTLISILTSILLLSPVNAATLQEVLEGHNHKGQSVIVMFDDCKNYGCPDAMGITFVHNNQIYVILDKSLKTNDDVILAILSHEALHTDSMIPRIKDSINEETEAFIVHSKYWLEVIKKHPEYLDSKDDNIQFLNYCAYLYLKGKMTDKYLRPFVAKIYKELPKSSTLFPFLPYNISKE
jgi:hypothetical protein